jgi:DNA-binding CsgD family transcriptional regulator
MSRFNQPEILTRIMEVANHLADLKSPDELITELFEINDVLGINGSVFVSFARNDDTHESYKFFNASPPGWCQEYMSNAWQTIDPCILYAAINNSPTLISRIPVRTAGQRLMLDAAARWGFRSGIVVPAHSPSGRSRMGVLYLGSEDPQRFDDEALNDLRLVLRALAGELLDWWTRLVRAELLAGGDLSRVDVEMLRLTRQGFRSNDIATSLGLSKGAVDQRMHRLTAKFNSPSRKDAADLAYQLGLLY